MSDMIDKRRIYFTRDDDIELLTLVNNENPFINENWRLIAEVLKERRHKNFSMKNVRERCTLLLTIFRANEMKFITASGREEGFDELNQLLQEASDLKKEVEINPQLKRLAKRKQVEAGKLAREEAAVKLLVVEPEIIEEIVDPDEDFILVHELIPDSPRPPYPPTPPVEPQPRGTAAAPRAAAAARISSRVAQPPSRLNIEPGPSSPSTVMTPSMATVTKKTRSATVSQMWTKLKDEQSYKNDLLKLENSKTENERKRIEYEYEIQSKKIKLEQDRENRITMMHDKMMTLMDKLINKLG